MNPDVAGAVAESVAKLAHRVTVVWHGGEPLSVGIERFRSLLEPFSDLRKKGRVRHAVQTNGTLLTDQWCALLKEEEFHIGVSLDGDDEQNSARLTWTGTSSLPMTRRGIDCLHCANLTFSIIAVVNRKNVSDPDRFYRFVRSLGGQTLNINVEEREGLNIHAESLSDLAVKAFWRELLVAWRRDPTVRIREFQNALGWLTGRANRADIGQSAFARDFWPTIAYNGDIVVLSPELISAPATYRDKFVVGNVLRTPLDEAVVNSARSWYVRDFFTGIERCAGTCEYFEYCGGGEVSNKYFEIGDITGTETAHCRHTKQFVIDAILDASLT